MGILKPTWSDDKEFVAWLDEQKLGANCARTIQELEPTIRAAVACEKAGIETVDQVCKYSRSDLLRLREFGKKAVSQLEETLLHHGYRLRSEGQPHDEILRLYRAWVAGRESGISDA